MVALESAIAKTVAREKQNSMINRFIVSSACFPFPCPPMKSGNMDASGS